MWRQNYFMFLVLLCLNLEESNCFTHYYYPGDVLASSLDCAQIWNQPNFCGHSIHVDKNQITDLNFYNFIARSAQVKHNCSLSLYYGFQNDVVTMNSSSNWLWQCWDRPVTTVCCECGICNDAETPSGEDSCAVVFAVGGCRTCNGFRLEVNDKNEFQELGVVNNEISSAIVKPGCTLLIYDEMNFQGNSGTVTDTIELFDEEWNDKISSLKCFCAANNMSTTTTTEIPSNQSTTISTTTSATITTTPPTTVITTTPTTTVITTTPTTTAITTNATTTTTAITTNATTTTTAITTNATTTTTTPATTTTQKMETTSSTVADNISSSTLPPPPTSSTEHDIPMY